jgi:tRNA(His) 5'-end guanylyltransferase|tara:strand:- start:345 stop:1145 length:801 start_codon:yes stop_codon:yes gene_type:complete
MGKQGALGDRMKDYEMRSQSYLPRRTYTIVRVDGKGFSKFTKNMKKPFDDTFKDAMVETAIAMAKMFHPKMVFYQSDEISLVFSDFDSIEAQQMYDGKVQKVVSLTAACATAAFNEARLKQFFTEVGAVGDVSVDFLINNAPKQGLFDSRVLCIPDYEEVLNYFVWRQKDATRNSISMASHALLGHSKCMNKSGEEKQEMLFQEVGVNWDDYYDVYKRGVVIAKQEVVVPAQSNPEMATTRNKWQQIETPIFTKDREFFSDFIPKL